MFDVMVLNIFLLFQRVIGHVLAVAVTELISFSYISACHRACSGCNSYGADKCEECASGYRLENDTCTG